MTKVSPIGTVGFNVLVEPRGFKGATENRKYSVELVLPQKEGQAFIDEIQKEATVLQAKTMERLKAQGKTARYTALPVTVKERGTDLILTFSRKENDGAPAVIDEADKAYKNMLKGGTKVQVAYEVTTYAFQSVIGITLALVGVKVFETQLSAADVAGLFGSTEKPKQEDKDLF